MSRLRNLLAQLNKVADLNENLYKEDALKNGTFELKNEVVEEVLAGLEYDVDYKETPGEGLGFHFSMEASCNLNKLDKFGTMSEEDKHYLVEDLKENEEVKAFFKDLASDIDSELNSHMLNINVELKSSEIKFTITAE